MSGGLRVLVVDDSTVYRKIVCGVVEKLDGCLLRAAVGNGREALEALKARRFDLVLLDVEMPEMDGPATLKEICRGYPGLPVVMISGLDERDMAKTIDALEGGALGFVTKPNAGGPAAARQQLIGDLKPLIEHLITEEEEDILESSMEWRPLLAPEAEEEEAWVNPFAREAPELELPRERALDLPEVTPSPRREQPKRAAREARAKPQRERKVRKARKERKARDEARRSIPRSFELLAIGVSTGGPKALASLFSMLPARLPVPVLIVQHMPPNFTRSLAERLDRLGPMEVREAEDGEIPEQGVALIAPGGRHMELNRRGELQLTDDPPVKGCRPSVDVLFDSLARNHHGAVLTLILTGMGSDGTDGLRAMGERGVYRLAQDAQSCVVYGMPRAAVEAGLIDEVLPLDQIPYRLHDLLR